MLVKTGNAEIISVVDPKDIDDDNKRKGVLANALSKAKRRISVKITTPEKDKKTES